MENLCNLRIMLYTLYSFEMCSKIQITCLITRTCSPNPLRSGTLLKKKKDKTSTCLTLLISQPSLDYKMGTQTLIQLKDKLVMFLPKPNIPVFIIKFVERNNDLTSNVFI